MRQFLVFLTVFGFFLSSQGQNSTVVAEKGDGIFSLLRKQGLDPVKYYEDFIGLNNHNLKNGSELYLGKEYIIPSAPDSYRNMALNIGNNLEEEFPIFDRELATISPKSERLKNAVIYLLPSETNPESSKELQLIRTQIIRNLAQELMVHGAKVYLIEKEEVKNRVHSTKKEMGAENAIGDQAQMQYYIEVINHRYLQNIGKYQRILVIHLNDTVRSSKYYEISIFHHKNSPEGERFAKTLQDICNKNSIARNKREHTEVFAHNNNLFLAKNVLPPVTMIDIGDTKQVNIQDRIPISTNQDVLTNIIANGVLMDYTNLSLEN